MAPTCIMIGPLELVGFWIRYQVLKKLYKDIIVNN